MTEKDERMLVLDGSSGWLLFWLILVPPIGYIWLFFGLKNVKRSDFEKL